MNETLRKLKLLIDKFEGTAERYAKFGARDTEPDGIFQVLLVQAFTGKKPVVPTTVDGWELYSDMKGNGLAAANLARAAKACVEFIQKVPLGVAGAVEDYLRDYCWRVSW